MSTKKYKKENFTALDKKIINSIFTKIAEIKPVEDPESNDAKELLSEVFFILNLTKEAIKKAIL